MLMNCITTVNFWRHELWSMSSGIPFVHILDGKDLAFSRRLSPGSHYIYCQVSLLHWTDLIWGLDKYIYCRKIFRLILTACTYYWNLRWSWTTADTTTAISWCNNSVDHFSKRSQIIGKKYLQAGKLHRLPVVYSKVNDSNQFLI